MFQGLQFRNTLFKSFKNNINQKRTRYGKGTILKIKEDIYKNGKCIKKERAVQQLPP